MTIQMRARDVLGMVWVRTIVIDDNGTFISQTEYSLMRVPEKEQPK